MAWVSRCGLDGAGGQNLENCFEVDYPDGFFLNYWSDCRIYVYQYSITVSVCVALRGWGEPDFDKIYFEAPKSGLDFRQRNLLKEEEEEENKTKKLHV